MVSCVHRFLGSLSSFPTLEALPKTAGALFRQSIGFCAEMLRKHSVGLAALGYDVVVGNRLGSKKSLFALYVFSMLLWRVPKVFKREDIKAVLFQKALEAVQKNDLLALRQFVFFIDVNMKDAFGNSLLHFASREAQPNPLIIDFLVSHKANPFIQNRMGKMPIDDVKYKVFLLRTILGCRNIKAFQGCKNYHDFYEVLFDPFTESLPENWREIVDTLPPSPLVEEWEKEAEDQLDLQKRSPSMKEIAEVLEKRNPSFEEGLEYVFTACPIAKRLFQLGGSPAIRQGTGFGTREFQVNNEEDSAVYLASSHTIEINDKASWRVKIKCLLFELLNSLNRERLLWITRQSKEGKISRTEYAILCEWCERTSIYWYEEIAIAMKEKIIRLDSLKFPSLWIYLNKPLREGLLPHAKGYMWDWDRYALSYLAKNPAFLERRRQELINVKRTCSINP